MPIYLDYNATAPLRPAVITLMMKVFQESGNATSVHSFGRRARKYVEDARAQVAALCTVKPEQIIFTSGATESINTALHGFSDMPVLVSAIEHPAGLAAAPHAHKIPVTHDGLIDQDAYLHLLKKVKPALVSIVMVNSETGVIQPIAALAKMAHDHGALFHTDAVQAAGRLPLSFEALGVDYMSLSAHKMAGPQGAGALILRANTPFTPFMLGGSQEQNRRSGTHNTAAIAGMGLAAQLANEFLPHYATIEKMRNDMEVKIHQISNTAVIYSSNAPRVGNTCAVSLNGVSAQTQLMALDLDGIAVSSGSACSSGSFKPSHVLTAMGIAEDDAKSALRISLGWATTSADIDAFIQSWSKLAVK